MNYTEAVNYIHSLLKFGIRPGLSGMDALLHFLGNPQKSLRFIHVAGTNGKGSVSTALSNILTDAGYKTGLYTSPYVRDFLERIQFCGELSDKNVFSENVEKVKNAVEELSLKDVVITEFEALTATAFLCFKDLMCDVVILEVGLGGRLDATNIIDTPLCNIITSLSLDHTGILGETIEEIAFEKCGTIKENGQVVCSFGQPEGAVKVVEETVKKRKCSLVIPDKNAVEIIKSDLFGTEFIYKNERYSVRLPGEHQVKNMTSVIECCELLKGRLNISTQNVKNGISETFLPARVEVMSKKPLVILDGGHNEDGARVFYNAVKDYLKPSGKVFVLAGMMADKAVENSLKSIMCSADCFVCVTPDNPRAMKSTELAEISKKYCENTVCVDSPVEAVDYIFSKIKADDVLCAVGSLYLAGEIRTKLKEKIDLFH